MTTNRSEKVFAGRVINVYREDVTLPNGNRTTLDLVKHPGASAIVPVTADGRFVLIKQYRYAAGGYLFEIPAGKLDIEGEDPLECAKRELKEETGYTASKWKKLTTILTTPGFSDEIIHIYLAEGLKEGKTAHEHDEVIALHPMTRKEVEKKIRSGEIRDAKTLVGLLMTILESS